MSTMEIDVPIEMEPALSELTVSQLTAKVESQQKMIQNLLKQTESQNQRLLRQEYVMRNVIQQVKALTISAKPAAQGQAVEEDNAPVMTMSPPQSIVAHCSISHNNHININNLKAEDSAPIFKGMHFFITADGGGDYMRGLPPARLPYPKDEYLQAILRFGGQVVDAVGRERGSPVFLISDQHARTVKYIYCLAAGIPCISYEWIRQCVNQRELVDYTPFILKSGYSLEQETTIERHLLKPLKDLKVFIATDSDELYAYWKPVLLAGEANLMEHDKVILAPPPETEILITDGACTNEMLEAAKERSIPIVRPEWLVQSIIMGVKADPSRQDLYSAMDE